MVSFERARLAEEYDTIHDPLTPSDHQKIPENRSQKIPIFLVFLPNRDFAGHGTCTIRLHLLQGFRICIYCPNPLGPLNVTLAYCFVVFLILLY